MNSTVLCVTRPNLVLSSLEEIGKRSQASLEKEEAVGFLDKEKGSQEVVNLIEQLRNAIAYYQVGGNHAARTALNTDEPDTTATNDIQQNQGTDCKISRRCL